MSPQGSDTRPGTGIRWRLAGHRELALLLALLAVAAVVRLPGVLSRSIWYDETISLLTSAGHAEPPWPESPRPAAEAQELFAGRVSPRRLVEDVRRYAVHPPGYYWALSIWRNHAGFSLESSRAFSLICSLGAVLTLYLLLRAAKVEGALFMTLVYALSTGAVHSGHEARAYALAGWLILTAAWLGYRAGELARRSRIRAAACALAVALAGGLAFHVNYLTLFPVAAVVGWLAICLWRDSRTLALATPVITLAIGALGRTTLLEQLDQRPKQLSGFVGFPSELLNLLTMNVQVLGIPLPGGGWQISTAVALGLFVALLGLTLVQIYRRWPEVNRRLWLLVVALATVPSAGMMLLDMAFDKHLHASRYVNLAGPALAVLVSYGLVTIVGSRSRVQRALSLACLPVILISNVNWGQELCPNGEFGGNARTLAGLIGKTSSPVHVVVLGEGHNHAGNPGSLIYELDPRDPVGVFGYRTDLDKLIEKIASYDDLWLIFSTDSGTRRAENELLQRLEGSGSYRGILRYGNSFHLAKIP